MCVHVRTHAMIKVTHGNSVYTGGRFAGRVTMSLIHASNIRTTTPPRRYTKSAIVLTWALDTDHLTLDRYHLIVAQIAK